MEVLAVVLLFFTLVAVILLKIKDYLFKKKDNYNLKFELVDVDEDEPQRTPVTTQVSAKLSPELYKKLNGYCNYKNVSKTSVINKAVEMYLNDIEERE